MAVVNINNDMIVDDIYRAWAGSDRQKRLLAIDIAEMCLHIARSRGYAMDDENLIFALSVAKRFANSSASDDDFYKANRRAVYALTRRCDLEDVDYNETPTFLTGVYYIIFATTIVDANDAIDGSVRKAKQLIKNDTALNTDQNTKRLSIERCLSRLIDAASDPCSYKPTD